jgi:hypothetical protein
MVLISSEGNRLRLHFPASNNIAEYEGLINGIRIAIELGATRLYAYGDSKLVVDQVMKESNCESSLMNVYCLEVRKLEDKLRGIELHHVPRKDNNDADALAKMAAQWDPTPSGVFVHDLHAPSICIKPDPPPGPSDPVLVGPSQVSPEQTTPDQALGGPNCLAMEVATSTADPDWRVPLLAYLLDEVLPPDRIEA